MQSKWRRGINVPDKLMEAINALVVKHFDGEQSVFLMSEFTKVVQSFIDPKNKDLLADMGKEIAFRYREAGWNVNTISGIYCKFTEGFVFSKKAK